MGVIYRTGKQIGPSRGTSESAANGIWDVREVDARRRLAAWPAQIVTDGLRLLFDPAVEESYSGSGTTLSDISGQANNGTLVNSPTYSSSNGGIFTLNGTNHHITTAYNENLGQNLSFGVWCRPTAVGLAGGGDIMIKQYTVAAPFASYGMDFTSAGAFRFYVSDGSTFGAVSSAAQTTNNWYYAFATYNSTGRLLTGYINGVSAASRSSASNILYNTNTLSIGTFVLSPTNNYFTGSLGQIQVYNRTLSAAEVTQNFNALRNRYGV